ncbi:hypothetical protein Emag_002304 [Eimeria magna]
MSGNKKAASGPPRGSGAHEEERKKEELVQGVPAVLHRLFSDADRYLNDSPLAQKAASYTGLRPSVLVAGLALFMFISLGTGLGGGLGAESVYNIIIRPFLLEHQQPIDAYVDSLGEAGTKAAENIQSAVQGGFNLVSQAVGAAQALKQHQEATDKLLHEQQERAEGQHPPFAGRRFISLSSLEILIMPVDPSRWMRQRHSHPRIGPEYQATIPSLEGGPYPHVPLKWMGEGVTAEGAAGAGTAEAAPAPAATGRASGRSRGGAAAHRQSGGVQTSRPVTRQMRASTRGATAARNADRAAERQAQQGMPAVSAEDMTFSAALLADAARELKESSVSLSGDRFVAALSRSTAGSSDTAAPDATPDAGAEAGAIEEAQEAGREIYGGFLPNSACIPPDTGNTLGASLLADAEESHAAPVEGSDAALDCELPRLFDRTSEALGVASARGDSNATNEAVGTHPENPLSKEEEEAGRIAAKHQVDVAERSFPKKAKVSPEAGA